MLWLLTMSHTVYPQERLNNSNLKLINNANNDRCWNHFYVITSVNTMGSFRKFKDVYFRDICVIWEMLLSKAN